MLSGIRYECLDQLNNQMRTEGRKIFLVTENCLSHPPIKRSPNGYIGACFLVCKHLKLVYLTKNTTLFLKCLDQDIIPSFKTDYR